MKIYLTIFILLIFTISHANDNSTIKKATKSVISGAVYLGKNIVTGVKEGIDDGRKSGESTDGAKIVTNGTELADMLTYSVESAEKTSANQYRISLVLKNNNDYVVRITNLDDVKTLVLIDNDGFAVPLSSKFLQGGDITVLGKSAARFKYTFNNVDGTPEYLRFFEQPIKLPAITVISDNATEK